jgi:hypothetical protein
MSSDKRLDLPRRKPYGLTMSTVASGNNSCARLASDESPAHTNCSGRSPNSSKAHGKRSPSVLIGQGGGGGGFA